MSIKQIDLSQFVLFPYRAVFLPTLDEHYGGIVTEALEEEFAETDSVFMLVGLTSEGALVWADTEGVLPEFYVDIDLPTTSNHDWLLALMTDLQWAVVDAALTGGLVSATQGEYRIPYMIMSQS